MAILHKNGILLVSLSIMMTLMTLAMVFIQRVLGTAKTAQAEVDRIQALYAAEAGLQKAIYYLNYTAPDSTIGGSYRIGTASSTACPSTGGSAGLSETLTISTGNTATYTMCIENSGYNVQITSTGTVVSGINGNVSRTVQAKTSQPLLATTSGGVNAANLFARWDLALIVPGLGTTDVSGNGYTAWFGGSPTSSTAALNDGVTHNTLTFDSAAYALTYTPAIKGSFTVTGWIKPTNACLAGGAAIGFFGNSYAASSLGMGYHLVFDNTVLALKIEASNGTTYSCSKSVAAWNNTTWYHFAAVYDNTIQYGTMYLNGVAGTSAAMKNSYRHSWYYYLGVGVFWGNDPDTPYTNKFSGSLADLRIYDRALNANEIAQIYNGYGSSIKMLKGSFKEL